MSDKFKIILAGVIILASFAAGRWLAPEKIKIEKETSTTDRTAVSKDQKKKVVTHEVVHSDGSRDTITTEEDETHLAKESDKTSDTKEKTEITSTASKVTISALAAVKPFGGAQLPVYGGAITRPILGPITIGGFFFTNGTIGASLGLTL